MKVTELIGKNVIVAPFNAYGVITYERLKASGVCVRAFFDKNERYHNSQYEDIPVFPWAYFYNTYIVIGHEQYDKEFSEFLSSIRYPEEYILKQSDIEFECSYDDANLNIDKQEFKRNFGWSRGMAIGQKLARMRKKYPQTDYSIQGFMPLIITTRCTLNCEHCFTKISYSSYGKYASKQYELFEQLNRNGILYYERHMSYWHKYGEISEPNCINESDFEKCKTCCCHVPTFFDGKMYSCEVLPIAGYLKMFPDDKRNYLDIFSEEFTKENFQKFIQSSQPAMAWCNSNHKVFNSDDEFTAERIPVAEQAKGIIPYKRYD